MAYLAYQFADEKTQIFFGFLTVGFVLFLFCFFVYFFVSEKIKK